MPWKNKARPPAFVQYARKSPHDHEKKEGRRGYPCCNYVLGNAYESERHKALGYYRYAALRRYAPAQMRLGVLLLESEQVEQQKDGFFWTTLAAATVPEARHNLGVCFEHGRGCSRDLDKALESFSQSYESGVVASRVRQGYVHRTRKEFHSALSCFSEAARQGDAEAMSCLALALAQGKGCPVDLEGAVKWHTKAAQLGHRLSQGYLACHYVEGQGCERDVYKALWLAQNAAKKGCPLSYNVMGCIYMDKSLAVYDPKLAVFWIRRSAHSGLAVGQYNLAQSLETGTGCSQNAQRALFWYRQAANQGSILALRRLGELLSCGPPSLLNPEEGKKYLKRAIELGDDLACILLAEAVAKDPSKAFAWILTGARRGSLDACIRLGTCLETGQGCLPNLRLAIECYRKAANEGEPAAYFKLGQALLQAPKTTQEEQLSLQREAFLWLEKAARQYRHPSASWHLSECYQYGYGCEANLSEACYWLLRAAAAGSIDAFCELGQVYSLHSEPTMAEAALTCLQASAERGDAKSQERLAEVLEDKEDALFWFRRAAQQGRPHAQFMWASHLLDQSLSRRHTDDTEALLWFTRAASQGHSTSMVAIGGIQASRNRLPSAFQSYYRAAAYGSELAEWKLGQCFLHGLGVSRDPVHAVQLFRRATLGEWAPEAAYELGQCYAHGDGCPRDLAAAAFWLRRSSESGHERAGSLLENLVAQAQQENPLVCLL